MPSAAVIFSYLKDRWPLWLALAVFIAFKIPHLHYPFYWDESWSYQPAIRLMYRHGPSLMPNAIDTAFSRGHPLLFYFSVAAWMRLFGPGAFSQHIFALLLSVLLITTMYEVSTRLFNKRTAILTLAILPLQVIFFVQSAMLLPEVMVALLALLSIYFYVAGKRVLTFLCLLALLLTKESGMVVGLLLGIDAVIQLFNKTKTTRERVTNILPVLLAGAGIVTFFIVQRAVNGWFFFPEHIGLISFSWSDSWDKIQTILRLLFNDDYRVQIFEIVLFFSLMVSINTHKIKYLLPLAIALMVYFSVADTYHGHHTLPKLIIAVLVTCMLAMPALLLSFTTHSQQQSKRFIRLGIYFIVLYAGFCSVNFFSFRYIIPALIFTIIFTAYYLERLTAMLYHTIYLTTVILILLTGWYGLNNDTGWGDNDMEAFSGMQVQRDVVTYLQQNKYFDTYISCSNFQDYAHLTDPNTGFIQQKEFHHITGSVDSAQLILFNNIEPGINYEAVKAKYKLVYRTQHKGMWGEIYKLK
jgi:4-amino-4-deoxy-L-arabinose transferase-like glycosyltransferase